MLHWQTLLGLWQNRAFYLSIVLVEIKVFHILKALFMNIVRIFLKEIVYY